MRPEEKSFENQNNGDNIYKPEIFRLINQEDKRRFEVFLSKYPEIKLVNKIDQQIEEFIKCVNPSIAKSEVDLKREVKNHIGDISIFEYGVWVYYPWLSKAVHLLDEKEFVEVRTSRNVYKITKEERDILATKKIGVIGLSVGQAIAYTICMERICGEIRLADFDNLDLSNMNRLSASLIDLGLNKCIIAARAISEFDPFIKVDVFSEGISKININEFLNENGKLDILIEECDSIEIKVLSRIEAKINKIPVLMDTNDSGIVDIERFDLEPERRILHGFLTTNEIDEIISGTPRDRQITLFLKFFDYNKISERLKFSFSEIGKSINSWPQLASSIAMGAGATTNVARRILLNSLKSSGRYYFDVETEIKDDRIV